MLESGERNSVKRLNVVGADRDDSVSSTTGDGIWRFQKSKGGGFHHVWQPSVKVVADIVAAVDLILIVLMAIAAKLIYVSGYLLKEHDFVPYLTAGLAAGFVFYVYSRWRGVYAFENLSQFNGQMRHIASGLGVTAFALLGAAYMFKISADYSRGWMIVWFALNMLALTASRYLLTRILSRWISVGVFARRIVVYGSGEITHRLLERLGSNFLRIRICGVFDDLAGASLPKVMLAGGLSELIKACQSQQIDEVLIALPLSEEKRIAALVRELSILPVDIRLCPDMAAFSLRPKNIAFHDNVAVLELERRPLDGWGPVLKAFEDRLLAGLMFVAALPAFLLIALAIKLDTSGPIFFRQRRHGFNQNIFMVWKFRTMTVTEDDANIVQAKRNDRRITRVGRWLRRTSLDELPQLFNVLSGEMSLVGPRPHAVAHNEHYSSLLGTYAIRHKVKPGITGWAQINGYRGETDTSEKMEKRVEYDLYYIENWALWFDIKILLLTPVSLFSKNAF